MVCKNHVLYNKYVCNLFKKTRNFVGWDYTALIISHIEHGGAGDRVIRILNSV